MSKKKIYLIILTFVIIISVFFLIKNIFYPSNISKGIYDPLALKILLINAIADKNPDLCYKIKGVTNDAGFPIRIHPSLVHESCIKEVKESIKP